jgi:hypothetical protein
MFSTLSGSNSGSGLWVPAKAAGQVGNDVVDCVVSLSLDTNKHERNPC